MKLFPSLPLGNEANLLSEHVDTRDVRLETWLSKSTPERRSDPVKEKSVSFSPISGNILPLKPLPLEKGDLLEKKKVEISIFFSHFDLKEIR